MTIRYLKDILCSARLYIRPLQCNVETDNDDDDEEDEELELFTHDVKVKFSEVSLIQLLIIISYIIIYEWYVTAIYKLLSSALSLLLTPKEGYGSIKS